MAEETTTLSDKRITVTNLRIMVGKNTYPMVKVKSADIATHKVIFHHDWVFVPLILLGLLLFELSAVISLIIMLVCLALVIYKNIDKDKYAVMLKTVESDKPIYVTRDKPFAIEVVCAVNEAIEDRKAKGLKVPNADDDHTSGGITDFEWIN